MEARSRRRDHGTYAAFGPRDEQRSDVLAHPRTADLLRDPVGFLDRWKVEEQDEMPLVDLEHTRRQPSGINGQRAPSRNA